MALSINDINRLEQENAELKEKIKKYAAINEQETKDYAELIAENERLKFKLHTVEADYEASEIEIEDLKNKLNLLTTANNHLLELDKYRQKELETKAEATKSNIHNLALLSKANKTLQEIKTIAKEWITDYCSLDCFYDKEGCCICHENKVCYSYRLLKAITKAEEK